MKPDIDEWIDKNTSGKTFQRYGSFPNGKINFSLLNIRFELEDDFVLFNLTWGELI